MKIIAAILFFFTINFSNAQGVLKSTIIGMSEKEICILRIRNVTTFKTQSLHYFDKTSDVVLRNGDYFLEYSVNDTVLHDEFIHISDNDFSITQKFVLRYPISLVDAKGFIQSLKLIEPDKAEDYYIEF